MDSSSIPEMKPFYWICETEIVMAIETEIETEMEMEMEKEMVRERCNQIQISETWIRSDHGLACFLSIDIDWLIDW